MPVVIIYGLKNFTKLQCHWPSYKGSIQSFVAMFLEIKEEEVTVLTPAEVMTSTQPDQLIVFVDGMFNKIERTKETKQLVSKGIKDILVKMTERFDLPYQLIEVFCRTFNQKREGFASWSAK